jgi:hypothetical protein
MNFRAGASRLVPPTGKLQELFRQDRKTDHPDNEKELP